MLKYFRPSEEYSWDALDELSGKRPGKWTWPLYSVGQLYSSGFEAEVIEDLDYQQFIIAPNEYLIGRFGEVAAAEQISNSDIPYEVEISKRYLSLTGKPRTPTIKDIEQFLSRGYLPICCLNLPALYGEPGYLGHFVLPTKVEEDTVIFHDPGIQTNLFPGRKDSMVSKRRFQEAWSNDRFLVGLKAK